MNFSYNQIKRSHVIEAIEIAKKRKRSLNPSTGYDLVFEGSFYPPKEILRIAFTLATGEQIGTIYGGERVNKYFEVLGFEIRRKNRVWKLGCNWESLSPSFFNFIRSESIAITVNDFPFQPDDLVLITEGFTVYALAKVKDKIKSVTEVNAYEEEFEKYNIPFEDWLKFSHVEWYDLPKSEVFQYKLQQGIRQVHKHDVLEKAFDIWENRKLQDSNLNFYVKPYKEMASNNWVYPCIVLTQTSWNDNGYYTSFSSFYYKDIDTRTGFGQVKILMEDETYTQLPKTFTQLNDNFISLGQSSQYYYAIRHELPFDPDKVLRALNDCTFDDRLNYRYQNKAGFRISLLRSSQAENIFFSSSDNSNFLGVKRASKDFEFSFTCQLPKALATHKVEFSFTRNEALPNRFFCLIGKNGTGKTKFLSHLAKKLANNNDDGDFLPERPIFSQVKVISFSLLTILEYLKDKILIMNSSV